MFLCCFFVVSLLFLCCFFVVSLLFLCFQGHGSVSVCSGLQTRKAGLNSPLLHVYCRGCNKRKATRRSQKHHQIISNHCSRFTMCELIDSMSNLPNALPMHSKALVVVQQHLFGGIPLQLLSCGATQLHHITELRALPEELSRLNMIQPIQPLVTLAPDPKHSKTMSSDAKGAPKC
jgi:hypothetical protein